MDGTKVIDAVITLNIGKFIGIMTIKYSFPRVVQDTECGIINKKSKGRHWTCYWKDGDKRKLKLKILKL